MSATEQRNQTTFTSRQPQTKPFVKKPGQRMLDNHEKDLVRFKREGAKVRVQLMSGNTLDGVLVDFDRFSLTILINGSRVPVFKHAIEYFYQTKQA